MQRDIRVSGRPTRTYGFRDCLSDELRENPVRSALAFVAELVVFLGLIVAFCALLWVMYGGME